MLVTDVLNERIADACKKLRRKYYKELQSYVSQVERDEAEVRFPSLERAITRFNERVEATFSPERDES